MRFKFEGRWEVEALAERVEQALVSFCKQYGIKSLSGINLYFHMHDDTGEQINLESPDGEEIAGVAFKNPNPPKRIKKKKVEPATVIPFQQKDSTIETK